jgi:hypothetical protein
VSEKSDAQRNIPDCRYREQYGVIVICRDEKHQKQVYEALKGKNYKLKVVVT